MSDYVDLLQDTHKILGELVDFHCRENSDAYDFARNISKIAECCGDSQKELYDAICKIMSMADDFTEQWCGIRK